MYLALRNHKNDCKILKIILVPDFCPLKPAIARFSIGFRLNLLMDCSFTKLIFMFLVARKVANCNCLTQNGMY